SDSRRKDILVSELRRCRLLMASQSRYVDTDSAALRDTWREGIDLMITVSLSSDKEAESTELEGMMDRQRSTLQGRNCSSP
ncbi:hypothetical protein PMAYCL1PPCAC_14127, partial [Pristionchus mayeri]